MIFQIKITMPNYNNNNKVQLKKSPYRIIEIAENKTLYKLAESILDAFDFDNDHLFGFYNNVKKHYESSYSYELATAGSFVNEQYGNVEKTKISEMLTVKNETWLFLFDFGDEWNFWVQLVAVVEKEKGKKYPRVIEKYLKAPEQYPDW